MPSPNRSRSRRHSEDQRLRAFGFTIYARKRGREAVWKFQGDEYTHSEAMELVDEMIAAVERGAKKG